MTTSAKSSPKEKRKVGIRESLPTHTPYLRVLNFTDSQTETLKRAQSDVNAVYPTQPLKPPKPLPEKGLETVSDQNFPFGAGNAFLCSQESTP